MNPRRVGMKCFGERDGRSFAEIRIVGVFALDPDRLTRFSREAQVLAALNHPHIAAIYGFEESHGVQALVLELVEGPTLADRLGAGSIPIDEALPIARQIVEALEAAHDQAIVHRDLKPADIKLRPGPTGRSRIVFNQGEITGNIWMTEIR